MISVVFSWWLIFFIFAIHIPINLLGFPILFLLNYNGYLFFSLDYLFYWIIDLLLQLFFLNIVFVLLLFINFFFSFPNQFFSLSRQFRIFFKSEQIYRIKTIILSATILLLIKVFLIIKIQHKFQQKIELIIFNFSIRLTSSIYIIIYFSL